MTQPYKGATTAQFYVVETTTGVTPTSPSWSPLRNTGGFPAVTRDSLISNEIGQGRETNSIRVGNEQISGEYAIELSQASQDELLACAMTAEWVAGDTIAAIDVTVTASTKAYTRASGSYITDGVAVGDLASFRGLTGKNSQPAFVTAVSALEVILGGAVGLTDEVETTTDLITGDKLETGNLCKSVSILTWFKGKCGTPDSYVITRGVEFSGFSIEQAVNAMVTGSFPFIGISQETLTGLPAGSTFNIDFDARPFASVDVSAFDGDAALELIDTFTITNDNTASAQFELGKRAVSYVERGRATNTFSLSGKLYDMVMVDKFLAETEVNISSILSGFSGAMSFTLNNSTLTSATPAIDGAESVTLAIEGQATGDANSSSITIQRISY